MIFKFGIILSYSLFALGFGPNPLIIADGGKASMTTLKYLGEVPLHSGSNVSITKAYYKSDLKKSWFAARSFCGELGLLLASVEFEAQQLGLQSFLKDDGVRVWWLAGTDLGHKGKFVWSPSGNEIPLPVPNKTSTSSYENWSQGQPDLPTNENCLRLWDDKQGLKSKWDDNACSNSYNFICERPSKCA